MNKRLNVEGDSDSFENSITQDKSTKAQTSSNSSYNPLVNNSMEQINDDKKWIEYLKTKLKDPNLSDVDKAYFNRIIRVHSSSIKYYTIIYGWIIKSHLGRWSDFTTYFRKGNISFLDKVIHFS